jgi:hypothetical protein
MGDPAGGHRPTASIDVQAIVKRSIVMAWRIRLRSTFGVMTSTKS